jgi:hypothetical protein
LAVAAAHAVPSQAWPKTSTSPLIGVPPSGTCDEPREASSEPVLRAAVPVWRAALSATT